jgi:Tetratricopeptide repeat
MNERLPTVAGSPRAISWVLASTAGIVVLHAWGAFHSPTRLWAFDAMRYLSPVAAWATWAVAAIALVPAVARALVSGGKSLAALRGWPLAIVVALTAWVLDDRTQFLGDFLLRQQAVEHGTFRGNFVQSSVGEQWIFDRVPATLVPTLGSAVALYPRMLGVAEAIVFSFLALAFAREWGARDESADRDGSIVPIALTLVASGALLTFTGIPKVGREAAIATLAAALFAFRALQMGRGMMALTLTVILGTFLHRSGLFLLPLWLVTYRAWSRSLQARADARRRRIGMLVLFGVGLLLVAPPAIFHWLDFDVPHHLVGANRWTGQSWLDLFDLWVVLAPLWIAGWPLWLLRPRGSRLTREDAAVWALAVPWLAAMIVTRPMQGLVRDWDVFAPGAIALTIAGLAGLRHAMSSRAAHWLVTSVALVTCVFTLQWMVLVHDTPRGLARIHAYASEATFLPASTRAQMFDFIGLRSIRFGSWPGAEDAYRRATELVPDRRMELTLASAQMRLGKYPEARATYRKLLIDHPGDEIAWLGLLGVGLYQGDTLLTREAGTQIDSYPRDSKEMREIRLYLHYFPDVLPSRYRTEVER